MKNLTLKKTIERRFFLLSALKGISFGILSWRLFDLQVIENKKYDILSKNNQFNFSLVVPERGEIYDRKGRVLAANRDAFSLYIKSSQNLNLKKILNKLLFITNLNKKDINNFEKRYKNLKRNSELYFSIVINLITKFVKTFQIYFVLIFLKRGKSSRFFSIL